VRRLFFYWHVMLLMAFNGQTDSAGFCRLSADTVAKRFSAS